MGNGDDWNSFLTLNENLRLKRLTMTLHCALSQNRANATGNKKLPDVTPSSREPTVTLAPSVFAVDPTLITDLNGHTVDELRAALNLRNKQNVEENGTDLEPVLESNKNRPIPAKESGGVSLSKTKS